MRIFTLTAALALIAGPALADLRPITIEEVRTAEQTGVPALMTVEDAELFNRCGIPGWGAGPGTMSEAEQMQIVADARATGLKPQIFWFRRYDAAIAKCLAKPGNH